MPEDAGWRSDDGRQVAPLPIGGGAPCSDYDDRRSKDDMTVLAGPLPRQVALSSARPPGHARTDAKSAKCSTRFRPAALPCAHDRLADGKQYGSFRRVDDDGIRAHM
jgi:hypothetical protein